MPDNISLGLLLEIRTPDVSGHLVELCTDPHTSRMPSSWSATGHALLTTEGSLDTERGRRGENVLQMCMLLPWHLLYPRRFGDHPLLAVEHNVDRV